MEESDGELSPHGDCSLPRLRAKERSLDGESGELGVKGVWFSLFSMKSGGVGGASCKVTIRCAIK